MSEPANMSPTELDAAAVQKVGAIENAADNAQGGPKASGGGSSADSVLTELAGNETTKYLLKGTAGTAANIGIAVAEGMSGGQKPNNDPLFGNASKKERIFDPRNNALGMPKTYAEMRADIKAASRALHQMRKRGGIKVGGLAGLRLDEKLKITDQSVGRRGVIPKGVAITLELAQQLNLTELIAQLSAIRQLQNAPGQQQIAKAMEGNDARAQQMIKTAAPSVMAEIKAPAPSAGAR